MSIKSFCQRKSLKKAVRTNTRKKLFKNLEQVKSAGILFERDSDQTAANMQKLAKFLHEQDIDVHVLAYVNIKKPTEEFLQKKSLSLFYKKDLNWYKKPKIELIHNFINQRFDIMIKADFSAAFPLAYICASSKASLVAGPKDSLMENYDFFIETSTRDQNEYHQQLIHYLSVINQNSTQKETNYA